MSKRWNGAGMENEETGVRLVCETHVPRPNPEYVKKPLAWFFGKDVKLALRAVHPSGNPGWEYMWVTVLAIDEAHGLLRGRLMSYPLFAGNRRGDVVDVRRDEIIEAEPQNSESVTLPIPDEPSGVA